MPSSASSTPESSTLSLHDALPIYRDLGAEHGLGQGERQLRDKVGAASFEPRVGLDPDRDHHVTRRLPLADPGSAQFDARSVRHSGRSEEHTSELQSPYDLVCRLLLLPPPRAPLFPYTTLFRSTGTSAPSMASARVSGSSVTRSAPRRSNRGSGLIRTVITTSPADSPSRIPAPRSLMRAPSATPADRKSTRLNSSHRTISYAVFCFFHPRELHSFPTRRSSDLQGPRRRAWPRPG